MPKKKNRPPPLKLWTIRISEKMLADFREGAELYGLHTQTFAKLIIEMGLKSYQRHGLLMFGDPEAERAATAHNRRMVLEMKKNRPPRGRPRKVTTHAVEGSTSGGSKTTANAFVSQKREPTKVVSFLEDAGVGSDQELDDVLSSLP